MNFLKPIIKSLYILIFVLWCFNFALAEDGFSCPDILNELSYENFFIDPSSDQFSYQYEARLELQKTILEDLGYEEYQGQNLSNSVTDALFFIGDHELSLSPVVFEFVTALQIERLNLQKIYGLSSQTYFELAKLTLGILEVETHFGQSPRYYIKELVPGLVTFLKKISGRRPSPNSRGLTQIKLIPKQISEHYGFTKDELANPYKSAIATMGYLAEALPWLRNLVAKYETDSVTSQNFYDHLIYLYSGRSSQIIQNLSTPDQNMYIRKLRELKPSLVIYFK